MLLFFVAKVVIGFRGGGFGEVGIIGGFGIIGVFGGFGIIGGVELEEFRSYRLYS